MIIQELVRENIKRLKPYSSARSEYKGAADVFLDANENPFDTGLNRYPDPLQWKLKEAISNLKGIPVKNIFLGNGSDEVIDLLIRIFCEPGKDRIVILPPTYGMYEVSASIADVEVQTIALDEQFQPDSKGIIEAAAPQSKLLFLCSPNNPTGNTFDEDKVHYIVEKFPGIVVVDEAYIDFSGHKSFSEHLEQYPNLVIMQTFSKAWGMAGIRLGMAFASKEIIGWFNKVKPPYNINQLTQQAALEALKHRARQKDWVDCILKEREKLITALIHIPLVKKIFPSDANFVLVRVDGPQEVYDYLISEKIIVRNRSTVLMCEGCLRITVGTAEENKKLIAALEKYRK